MYEKKGPCGYPPGTMGGMRSVTLTSSTCPLLVYVCLLGADLWLGHLDVCS